MSGILTTAAQRVNADTAGRTTHPGEANAGEAVAATPAEMYHSVIHTANGALDSLFRQEPLSASVSSPAVPVATTATRGPHGGLVPASVSNIVRGTLAPSPGPGPSSAVAPAASDPAAVVRSFGADTAGATKSAWASLRRVLGI